MLNIIYGWCAGNINRDDYTKFVTESIDGQYAVTTKKDAYPAGGLYNYAKYKTSINYSNRKYILSLIGDIFLYPDSLQLNTNEDIAKEIIHQYDQQGQSFLEKIKGQFILSIIDKTNNSCLIINDTMASFPLFYALTTDGQFVFSNHLNLLTQSPNISCTINKQAIYDYIYFHMIPSPATIFQKIYKLEPKQFLFFKDGKYSVKTYSPPIFNENNTRSENELAKDIFDTLDKSVQNCIDTSKTTGCFLSGGLDSSAVAGMLAKNTNNNAKTFSIGFPVAQYNEIEYARIASKTFKTTQYEYFIQPEDIHNVVHNIVSSMDEPFGNSSVIPVYYCAKLAKENGVNHLLGGDGGDEIFAGNTRYSKQQIFERYFILPKLLRKKIVEPLSNISLLNSNFIGRKIKRYISQANIPLPARLETYNFLHIHSPDTVFSEVFLSQVNQDDPINLINKAYDRPHEASFLNRMLYLDWKHTLADNDLRKVSMMCDLAGIDVSYPMLSAEMIELSCQIPSDLKLTPHKLRYLYKKSMDGFLPDTIINKAKHGFGLPFGVWTKTDEKLQEIAYNAIESLKSYQIFNEHFLDDTIHKHQNEHASFYGELIWILMVLGIWLDKHNNGSITNE